MTPRRPTRKAAAGDADHPVTAAAAALSEALDAVHDVDNALAAAHKLKADLMAQETAPESELEAVPVVAEVVTGGSDPTAALAPGGLTPDALAAAMGLPSISPDIAIPAIAAAHATVEREMGRAFPQDLPHNLAQARWMIAASLVLKGQTEPPPAEEIPSRVRYFILLAQGRRR